MTNYFRVANKNFLYRIIVNLQFNLWNAMDLLISSRRILDIKRFKIYDTGRFLRVVTLHNRDLPPNLSRHFGKTSSFTTYLGASPLRAE